MSRTGSHWVALDSDVDISLPEMAFQKQYEISSQLCSKAPPKAT